MLSTSSPSPAAPTASSSATPAAPGRHLNTAVAWDLRKCRRTSTSTQVRANEGPGHSLNTDESTGHSGNGLLHTSNPCSSPLKLVLNKVLLLLKAPTKLVNRIGYLLKAGAPPIRQIIEQSIGELLRQAV